ncbi:MAG: hypothetical protein U9N78_11215 [Actinomycetota bacterium]|nr:hypothetical protein [Actinomycetota bacterium]
MGQPIVELDRVTVGDVTIFTLDRNLASMGTYSFDEAPAEPNPDDFVDILAVRIFESDPAINRVYVAANAVQVTRRRGWDDATESAVGTVISDLFRFYPDPAAPDVVSTEY